MSRPKLWTRDQVCPDSEETVNKLRRVMNILYSFYDCDDLKFNKTDPTMEHYSNSGLYKQRQRLLTTVINECREALSGSIVHNKEQGLKYSRPFSIDDLIEDDFDSIKIDF